VTSALSEYQQEYEEGVQEYGEEPLTSDGSFTAQIEYVQWYPGHIARAERMMKQSLKLVDVVIEVRDARIPLATRHPQLPEWVGTKEHVVVMNREDMISPAEKRRWRRWFVSQGENVIYTDARLGTGILKVARAALMCSNKINNKRAKRGLKSRSVRCAVVGFPNVGKSALINRLVGKKKCKSAATPGITRQLSWVRVADGLDLMDSPGVLPPRLDDQAAAARLAMCNDIGEAAYTPSLVATAMLLRFQYLQGYEADFMRTKMVERYGYDIIDTTPEEMMEQMANEMYKGDKEAAGTRILRDYRMGYLGMCALENPPDYEQEVADDWNGLMEPLPDVDDDDWANL